MLYYIYRDKIDKIFSKNFKLYLSLIIVLFLLHIVFTLLRTNEILLVFKHISFLFIVILITMKIKISNLILNFCGKHLFSIFMLQRLPMIILSHFGIENKPMLFLVLTVVITIAICIPFDYLIKKLDNAIFNKQKIAKI